jgi:hypothetical protein
VAATDTLLVTLRPGVLSKDAEDAVLRNLHDPGLVSALLQGSEFTTNIMSANADGLFFRHEKIGETAEVFERLDRADVRAVKGRVYRTNSTWPTVLGAVTGGFVGVLFAGGIANSEIPKGAAERDIFLSIVGMPVAGGFIGAWLSRHDEQTVYYDAGK